MLIYPSGVLMGEANFKNGNLEGLNKKYYESGEIKEEAYYKDGKLTNIRFYNEQGNLLNQ